MELGVRVRRRRESLGLTIDQAADAGTISPVTWSRVELGRTVRGLSYGAVDAVLSWAEGACKRFLADGTEPTSTHHAYDGDGGTATEEGTSVRRTAQGKAGGTLGSLTASAQGAAGRNLQPLEGGGERAGPDEFGLGSEPPFPGVVTNSSGLNTPEILNRVWAAAKEKERLYYERYGTTSERQLRVIQQSLLADVALLEELGDAG